MPESGLPIRVYKEHDMWHVHYGEGQPDSSSTDRPGRPAASLRGGGPAMSHPGDRGVVGMAGGLRGH